MMADHMMHINTGLRPVIREMVQNWSVARRFWNNVLAMLGPVLYGAPGRMNPGTGRLWGR